VLYYIHKGKGVLNMGTVYARVIVDELGYLVEYASDLTGAEINEMLEEHPEWRLTIQAIGMSYGTANDELEGVGF
jgi:hypothetical protein